KHGVSVLVLDTATGSGAETFYQRAGWQKVGEIPRYALMPDGAMTATSVFYKFL
ncbi:GNAT family N-acetyltransferase, partial [Enterococcus faecalis]